MSLITTTAVAVSGPGVSDTSSGRLASSWLKIRAPGAVNERTSPPSILARSTCVAKSEPAPLGSLTDSVGGGWSAGQGGGSYATAILGTARKVTSTAARTDR